MKSKLILFLKGIAMGAADVVPGVSGGTIAFITGIYERLLNAIKEVDLDLFKLLLKFRIKDIWKKVDGNFLLVLFLGIGTSLVTLAKVMTYLLDTHPILIWSLFFGLIIASAVLVGKTVEKWNFGSIVSLIIGAIIAYAITEFTPTTTPETSLFVFISGAIAICAMILPGVSGAFILLLLGKYQYVIGALSDFNLKVIIPFGLGAVVGIVTFSHLLTWLLNRFRSIVIALLTGFMIGSLNKVWPWKETLETFTNSHGVVKPLVQDNISPIRFFEITGEDPRIAISIVLAIAGYLLISTIEKYAVKKS